MHCDVARDLLGAYTDGELSGAERQAIADHLQTCSACAAAVADLRLFSQEIIAARETAPATLALRVRMALADAAADADRIAMPTARRVVMPVGRQAAFLAAACLVSSLLTWSVLTWSQMAPRVEADIVSAHIRSLLQDSPFQVASSDSHTVKPWFTGRLDFSPEVRDFATQGFPLVGGRVDYIDGRRVGAIVYRRNLHVVNVFMWPAAEAAVPAPIRRDVQKGYNILNWTKSGVTYWAISDTNIEELSQLQSLL